MLQLELHAQRERLWSAAGRERHRRAEQLSAFSTHSPQTRHELKCALASERLRLREAYSIKRGLFRESGLNSNNRQQLMISTTSKIATLPSITVSSSLSLPELEATRRSTICARPLEEPTAAIINDRLLIFNPVPTYGMKHCAMYCI